MNKTKSAMVLAAILIPFGLFNNSVSANRAHHSPEEITFSSDQTTNNYISTVGSKKLVTNKNATGYIVTKPAPKASDQNNHQSGVNPEKDQIKSIKIPKNSVLNIKSKFKDSQSSGYKVTLKHSKQTVLVRNPQKYTYNTKTIKLSKKQEKSLNRSGKRWSKSLTKDQRKAVIHYTGNGSDAMNDSLRKPSKKTPKKVTKQVNRIKKSLNKFKTKFPMTVYRGTSESVLKAAIHHKNPQVGDIYQDKGFSSTSLKRSVGTDFQSKVLLKIQIPKSKSGAYIAPISDFKEEKEYLVKPKTKFIITKIQKVKSYLKVHLSFNIKSGKHKNHHKQTFHDKLSYWFITMNLLA